MATSAALTRKFAYAVGLTQVAAGLTGIFSASHFESDTYKPAREVVFQWVPGDPSTYWSVLLVVLAVAAVVVLRLHRRRFVRPMFALLAAYWVFWTVLYLLAWPNPDSGPWAPWFALMCVVGNARPVMARQLVAE